MENKKMTLRTNPKLEILFYNKNFEIVDNKNKNNSGVFDYELTKSIRLEKRKINWIVSLLSIIVEFALFNLSGNFYHQKSKLRFSYNMIEKEFNLDKCDKKMVEKSIENLKVKTNS